MDCDRIALDIFRRMKDAGWLLQYRFTQGKGWWLDWTEVGAIAAVALNSWADLLAFDEESDHAPRIAYVLARGTALGVADPNHDEVRSILARYVSAGLAAYAGITADGMVDVRWTAAGQDFRKRFCDLTDRLEIGPDEDALIMLFQIAEGWCPDSSTPTYFLSDN
jgi:hypothetical protein